MEESAKLSLYRTKEKRADLEPGSLHIHVDSQKQLEPEILLGLYAIGLVDDSFDHNSRAMGLNGDPYAEFPHYEPVNHLTYITRDYKDYRRKFQEVKQVLANSKIPVYVEGEAVALDYQFEPKPFNEEMFNQILSEVADVINPDYYDHSALAYRSALDDKIRQMPVKAGKRRLAGLGNEMFRKGEMHLTIGDRKGDAKDGHENGLEDSPDPRLLEFLYAIGFSAPSILKTIEMPDKTLKRDKDGKIMVIRDIPLTMQALDMQQLIRLANIVVTVMQQIGGYGIASIKIESAIGYELMNNVSHEKHIPPVLSALTVGDAYRHLDSSKVGEIDFNLGQSIRKLMMTDDRISR